MKIEINIPIIFRIPFLAEKIQHGPSDLGTISEKVIFVSTMYINYIASNNTAINFRLAQKILKNI